MTPENTSVKAFFCNEQGKYARYIYCEVMIEALHFLPCNLYVSFGDYVYRQVVGIPMGTHCAPLIIDVFLYYYESQFKTHPLVFLKII